MGVLKSYAERSVMLSLIYEPVSSSAGPSVALATWFVFEVAVCIGTGTTASRTTNVSMIVPSVNETVSPQNLAVKRMCRPYSSWTFLTSHDFPVPDTREITCDFEICHRNSVLTRTSR